MGPGLGTLEGKTICFGTIEALASSGASYRHWSTQLALTQCWQGFPRSQRIFLLLHCKQLLSPLSISTANVDSVSEWGPTLARSSSEAGLSALALSPWLFFFVPS